MISGIPTLFRTGYIPIKSRMLWIRGLLDRFVAVTGNTTERE